MFEHALRIRIKAEAHSSTTTTPSSSTPATPGTTTPPDVEHNGEGSSDTEATLHSPAASESEDGHSRATTLQGGSEDGQKAKSEATKPSKEEADETEADAKNLVGRINNLVTTDLNNIVDSRDFIRLVVYTPVSVFLCVAFLYVILGWR